MISRLATGRGRLSMWLWALVGVVYAASIALPLWRLSLQIWGVNDEPSVVVHISFYDAKIVTGVSSLKPAYDKFAASLGSTPTEERRKPLLVWVSYCFLALVLSQILKANGRFPVLLERLLNTAILGFCGGLILSLFLPWLVTACHSKPFPQMQIGGAIRSVSLLVALGLSGVQTVSLARRRPAGTYSLPPFLRRHLAVARESRRRIERILTGFVVGSVALFILSVKISNDFRVARAVTLVYATIYGVSALGAWLIHVHRFKIEEGKRDLD